MLNFFFRYHLSLLFLLSMICGFISGYYYNNENTIKIVYYISDGFVSYLKWISIPMIFFCTISAAFNINDKNEFFKLSKYIIKYTFLTTAISAFIALLYFLLFNPSSFVILNSLDITILDKKMYKSNFGIILLFTIVLSLFICLLVVELNKNIRNKISHVFLFFYNLIMNFVNLLLYFMPIVIWSFVALFIIEFNYLILKSLLIYLLIIFLSNFTQAFIVLPFFLKINNIKPLYVLKNIISALLIAFWSRSSSIALPVTIASSIKLGISDKIAKFAFPLCTTLNMNACASFIIVTVLYVAESNGYSFNILELFLWIFISTLAAIGNAGIPMGCYALSSVLLAYLDVPLYLLGVILPFYTIIDMVETSTNVWSDICIVAIIDKNLKKKDIY